MYIDGLGELTVDESVEDWLVSKPVSVTYFGGTPLHFIFDGLSYDSAPEDFIKAFRNFMKLTQRDRDEIGNDVFKYYLRFVDAVGSYDAAVKIERPDEVWEHIKPTEIYISRQNRDGRMVYVQVAAECSWDREHGLQIVYRDGITLSRVSEQDGHLT